MHRAPASFTLVEMSISLAIVIILLLITAPAIKGLLGASSLQTAGRQMYAALSQARAHAIATRKATRVFFPVATRNGPSGTDTVYTRMYKRVDGSGTTYEYTTAELAGYHNNSYIIASLEYDASKCSTGETQTYSGGQSTSCSGTVERGWRWIAQTAWQFLPAGIVFDYDTRNPSTSGSGTSCVVDYGGQTAFPHHGIAMRTDPTNCQGKFVVYYFRGASGYAFGESVTFGNSAATQTCGTKPNSDAAYIEFGPTGLSTSPNLILVEGFRPQSSTNFTVTYTNANVSGSPAGCTSADPCPNNYVLIAIDGKTGRFRMQRPGGPEGGCP